MRVSIWISGLATCLLVACTNGEPTEVALADRPAAPVAGAPSHDHSARTASSDQADATGLIRPGAVVPENADTSHDGTPRDGYGRPYTHAALGLPLPAFSGLDDRGEPFSSSDLLGRWTVIEIWGLWCHDSMHDAPYAAALSRALDQDPAVDFMTIHTPQAPDKLDEAFGKYTSVAAYFEDKGYRIPTVIDRDASIRADLFIRWTPTYLVVAPDGTVQAFRTGLGEAPGEPVKDFVRQISEIRGTWSPASE